MKKYSTIDFFLIVGIIFCCTAIIFYETDNFRLMSSSIVYAQDDLQVLKLQKDTTIVEIQTGETIKINGKKVNFKSIISVDGSWKLVSLLKLPDTYGSLKEWDLSEIKTISVKSGNKAKEFAKKGGLGCGALVSIPLILSITDAEDVGPVALCTAMTAATGAVCGGVIGLAVQLPENEYSINSDNWQIITG